jgi:sodium pump decarboxylase gamma subunit
MHMTMGMGFTFILLAILVGYMKILSVFTGETPPVEEGQAESEHALQAMAEYQTGSEISPGVSAAIAAALFEMLGEEAVADKRMERGVTGQSWHESGRARLMAQREMWSWRKGVR